MTQLAIILASADNILALRGPASVQTIHAYATDAAEFFIAVTNLIAEAIDTADLDTVAEAERLLLAGNASSDLARQAACELCE